jgi:hypothetical protein
VLFGVLIAGNDCWAGPTIGTVRKRVFRFVLRRMPVALPAPHVGAPGNAPA